METKYKAPRFLLKLFNMTAKEDMNYIYRGVFTQKITDSILELAERNLEGVGDPTKIRRRVYFIMVESLQNVTRYQSQEGGSLEESAIFGIQKQGPNYLITTGNLIDNDKIPYVRKQLERVNSLGRDELKEYYKEILRNGKFTNEGGAGLGLIEMARKSGNKLSFDFRNLNEECSYFYLHTVIPSLSAPQTTDENFDSSLLPMIELHKEFNYNDILLVFNSGFSQENLLNLLNVIEKQISIVGQRKKKFFNILIEMVQNIIHHASTFEDENVAKSGIFFIKDKKDRFSLNAGNYIYNDEIKIFKDRLDKINALSNEELDEYYNEKLFDFKNTAPGKAGLGMLDLRIKSENKLFYHFEKINKKVSFFTLEIEVVKKM